jgi:hypothetical protein
VASKLKKPKQENKNFLIAIIGILAITLVSSLFCSMTIDYILQSLNNSNCMVMLITDAGIKSDDINLERNLSSATQTLITLKDISLALFVGSLGVSTALLCKAFKTS